MNWLKQNWFKLGITFSVFLIAGAVFYYLAVFLPKTAQRDGQLSNVSLALPINILPTDDGLIGSGVYANKYPNTYIANAPADIANQIEAYGASYSVWLAPMGWTGSGGVGADGNILVNLKPIGTNYGNGAQISYEAVPACYYCLLKGAAPYFSNALANYNATYNQSWDDNVIIPEGMRVVAISSTLITYTLPDKNGLSTKGAVYYYSGDKNNDPYFTKAEFSLPTKQTKLVDFLVDNFIKQKDLK